MEEKTRFYDKIRRMLKARGETLMDLEYSVGVARQTVMRGVKQKSTLAAIAYHMKMPVEEMVQGTEMEEVWYA